MSLYDEMLMTVKTVSAQEPETATIEPPQTQEAIQTEPMSALYNDMIKTVKKTGMGEVEAQEVPSETPELTLPKPTTTMEFTEPTEITPPETRERYAPAPITPSYGTFGTQAGPPPPVPPADFPEKISAYAHRGIAAAENLIAPEMAKTAILQPTPEKKTEQAIKAAELPKEAAIHGKAAEILEPTTYTSQKIIEKLDELRGQKPSLSSSFQMGNLSGNSDINVTNAFMSGDEEAKRSALDTQRQVRELAGEYQKVREGRKGFLNGVENVAESVSEMLPMMGKSAAQSAIPVIGPMLSTSMWAKQGAGDIITQLKEDGAPDDVALAYGLAGGLAYSLVEQVQIGHVLNPAVKKAVGNTLKKKLFAIAKEKGTDWFKEVGEEVIQGLVTENTIIDALKASGVDVDPKKVNQRYIKTIKENFIGSAWPMAILNLVGLGAGAGKVAIADRGQRLTEIVNKETGEITPIEGEPSTAPQPAQPQDLTQVVNKETGEVTPIGENVPKETLEDFDLDLESFDNLPPKEQEAIFAQLNDDERNKILEGIPAIEETRTIEQIREAAERGKETPLPVPPIPKGEIATSEQAKTEQIPLSEEETEKPKSLTERLPLLKEGRQAIRHEAVESGMYGKTELEQLIDNIDNKYEEKPTKKQVTQDFNVDRETAGKAINNSRFNKEPIPSQPKETEHGLQGQTETEITEGIPKTTIPKETKPIQKEVPSAKANGTTVEERSQQEGINRGEEGRIRIRDNEKNRMETGAGKEVIPPAEIKQPILKEKLSESISKTGREALVSPAAVAEGQISTTKEKGKEVTVGKKQKPVQQRLEAQQERGRTVRAKSRRPASVKRVAEEEKYTPEYWKEQHSHQLNVSAYNALRDGWVDRNGKEHPGKQKGWVDDYNLITDSKAPGGSKSPALSNNAKQWVQDVVDNINENPQYVDELNAMGISKPENVDDLIALLKTSKNASEFIQFHNEFEKSIREPDTDLDQYDEALKVFNEEPYNLTPEQKEVLERTWGATIEDVIARERGEKPKFAKRREPKKFMQQDLFGGEKSVEQIESEEKKQLQKTEVKRKTEEKKGGEADLTGLPMFEDLDIEGSQQTLKFAKGKVDPFYSPLLKAVQNLKQTKGPALTMLNLVKRGSGVKQQEIDWIGLEDFLKDKKSITKVELERFVAENQVVIKTIMKGGSKEPLTWQNSKVGAIAEDQYGNTWEVVKEPDGIFTAKNGTLFINKNYDDLNSAMIAAEEMAAAVDTKFSSYTLPGGKNYREVLITMPSKTPVGKEISYDEAVQQIKNNKGVQIRRKGAFVKNVYLLSQLDQFRTNNYTLHEYMVPDWQTSTEFYYKGHFKEPNIVVHFRVNDRLSPDNEAVLFVEEVQSDWERMAREKGVVEDDFRKYNEALAEKYNAPIQSNGEIPFKTVKRDLTHVEYNEWYRLKNGVPKQPFLDSWMEIALKRILRMAAEEGYDRIAFINGDQTKKRYSLSNIIDKLIWIDSKKLLAGYKDGKDVFVQYLKSSDEIKKHVGKGVAKRLLETVPITNETWTSPTHIIQGKEDFEVGGEWANALYDVSIPNFLKKYGKKWNAKVESIDSLSSIKDLSSSQEEEFFQWLIDEKGFDKNKDFKTSETKKYEQEYLNLKYKQPSLPITESMKRSVLEEGQPLFAKSEKGTSETTIEVKKVTPQEKQLTDIVYGSVDKEPKYGSIQIVKDVAPDSKIGAVGKVVEESTGKKVVFIKTDDRSLKPALGFTVDGFSIPGLSEGVFKDTIFINVDSDRPMMWTAYHEFAHFLETNPEYKKRFWGAVKLTDKGMAELAKEGQSELTADIIGEMMSREDFWENLAKQGRTPFENILKEFMRIISKIRSTIRKIITSDKITDEELPEYAELLVDVNAARNELGRIYSDYRKMTGKEVGDIPVRLATAKRLFRMGKLRRIPEAVKKPTRERMKEAIANEKDREKKARDLERQIYAIRKSLKGISRTSAEKRAELAIKLDTLRGGQVWEIKNAIYEYAQAIGLSGVPYNRVDLMLKNTNTAAGLKKAVEYLDEVWNKFERRSLYTKVLDMIEENYNRIQKIQAGKLRSTVPAEYNKFLKDYLDRLRTTPEWFKGDDYNDMVDKMVNYYNMYGAKDIQKAENVSDLPLDIQDWLKDPDASPVPPNLRKLIRSMFQNSLSDMTTDQLKDVIDDINLLRDAGRTVLEMQEYKRMQEVNEKAEEVADLINANKTKAPPPEFVVAAQRGRTRTKDFSKRLKEKAFWAIMDPQRTAKWLVGFNEDATEKIFEQLHYKLYDAEARKQAGMRKAKEDFLQRHKGIKWHNFITKAVLKIDLKKELEDVGLEYNGVEKDRSVGFTLDNMMFYYANTKNPGNLAHLRGTIGSAYKKDFPKDFPKELAEYNDKVMVFNNSIINKVVDALPQKYKDMVDEQIKYYDEVQWARMNEAFEKDMLIMMPKEDNYFPVMNIKTDRAENAVVADYLARNSYRVASVQKGNTKSRVLSAAPFRETSYFNTVVRNIAMVEHYIAYNQAIKETSAFLRNKKVRSAIESKSEVVYKELDEWIKAVATGTIDKSNNPLNLMFDLLRKNFISFALAIKPTTVFKQFGSLPKGMAYLDSPIVSIMKSNFNYAINPIAANEFADMKSELMRNRLSNTERELAEQNEHELLRMFGDKSITPALLREIGMLPMGWVDKQICVVLWNARYHEVIGKAISKGKEITPEIEKKAVHSADNLIINSQSRGGVLYMPSLYRTAGVLRGFTIFTSDTNQNLNIAFEIAHMWGLKPTVKNLRFVFWTVLTTALIEFVINQAVEPLWALIQKMVGSDEPKDWRGEELIKEIASQYTRGVPIVGQVADALVGYGAYRIKDARGLLPDERWNKFISDFAPAGTQSVEELVKAISTGDTRGVLEAIATSRGIPTKTLLRYGTGAKALQENGIGKWRKLFWSDYQLREETVYDAMSRRFYKLRIGDRNKQKEFDRYLEWYDNLHPVEQQLFDNYRDKWFERYIEGKIKKLPGEVEDTEE